jgi:hypothetical protein
MKKLILICLALIACNNSDAGQAKLTWTHTMLADDGVTPTQIQKFSIYSGLQGSALTELAQIVEPLPSIASVNGRYAWSTVLNSGTLQAGRTYCFTVSAWNQDVESVQSDPKCKLMPTKPNKGILDILL